jgi:NAD(P)-dependent dehydrogenase (short-subunit alcohol dehydrogenase family)
MQDKPVALVTIELEPEGIKVNAVSPGFTRTNLNGYAGTETVEEGAREAVRVALLGPDGPTGTFTRWKGETIPWLRRTIWFHALRPKSNDTS